MNQHAWVQKYYTPAEISALNPSVIMDGKLHAVLKLTTGSGQGVAKIAYIGVKKTGRNGFSTHEPLWDGPASSEVMKTFRQWLEKADAA